MTLNYIIFLNPQKVLQVIATLAIRDSSVAEPSAHILSSWLRIHSQMTSGQRIVVKNVMAPLDANFHYYKTISLCFNMAMRLFIKVAFHQSGISSKRLFIKAAFHQSGFSSKRLFIKADFHQNGISSKRLFIKVAFH